ncbi:MAG: AzlC family ABC transporter permease [Candidatus Merdivicinus sp.]
MTQHSPPVGPVLSFQKGLRDGIPICLGYFSVSFAFGMMAVEGGLPVWLAVLISVTNLTSSGQVAGTGLILAGGSLLEIGITTFVINIRYLLMSLSLSQKIDTHMSILSRLILSHGNTDEIFAVAMQQRGQVPARYLAGLIFTPYIGWVLGTFSGAVMTGLLPAAVRSALGIALYGMFLAIIVPPARQSGPILFTILLSAAISCLFYYLPGLSQVSTGWVMIICAVLAAGIAAWKFPMKDPEESTEDLV